MTYSIRALSWISWSEITSQISAGTRWFYADLDGAHWGVGLPADPPLSTHLWGWEPAGQRWLRLRMRPDGSGVGAELTGDGSASDPSGSKDFVTAHAGARTWSADSTHVGIETDPRGAPITLLQVTTPVSLVFMAIDSRSGASGDPK